MKCFVMLLVAGIFWVPMAAWAFDGFDFPVGYPNGTGWNNGSNCFDDVHCDNGSCTDGLFFKEKFDYGGTTGCVLHPGEDWNKNSGSDCGESGSCQQL